MKTTISPIQKTATPFTSYSGKVLTLWMETYEDRLRLLQNPEFVKQFTIIYSEEKCVQHLANLHSSKSKPWLLINPTQWKHFDSLFKQISRKKKGRIFILDQSTEAGYLSDRILVVNEQGETVDEIEPSFL